MMNNETNELTFENVRIPADSLIGEEDKVSATSWMA